MEAPTLAQGVNRRVAKIAGNFRLRGVFAAGILRSLFRRSGDSVQVQPAFLQQTMGRTEVLDYHGDWRRVALRMIQFSRTGTAISKRCALLSRAESAKFLVLIETFHYFMEAV